MITGDLNIDLLNFDQNNKVNNFLNMMSLNGFSSLITLPTRVTEKSATLIDHIFIWTCKPTSDIFAGNLICDISDHFANFCICDFKNKAIKTYTTDASYIRIFNENNKHKFKTSLSSINWNILFNNNNDLGKNSSNRPTMYECFSTIVQNNFEQCFPETKVTNRQ